MTTQTARGRRMLPPNIELLDATELLSIADVARYMGKSYRTVLRWKIEGALPKGASQRVFPHFTRNGPDSWVITGEDLRAFAAALQEDRPRQRSAPCSEIDRRLALHGL